MKPAIIRCEDEACQDAGPDAGQDHIPENLPAVRAQALSRLLLRPVERRQARSDGDDDVGERNGEVPHDQREGRILQADDERQAQHSERKHQMRKDQRGDEKRIDGPAPGRRPAIKTESRHRAEHDRERRNDESDKQAPASRQTPILLLGDVLVPTHAETLRRKL